jgi:hypothetical protein
MTAVMSMDRAFSFFRARNVLFAFGHRGHAQRGQGSKLAFDNRRSPFITYSATSDSPPNGILCHETHVPTERSTP